MFKKVDLTGQKFGRLTVLSQERVLGARNIKVSKCLCICECGKTVFVYRQALRNGETTSCGCYALEISRKKPKHASLYNIYGSYKRNAKNDGLVFELTENQVYELISNNCNYCGSVPQPWNVYMSRKRRIKHLPETIERSWVNVNGIDRVDSERGIYFE